jgi:hypothetical protein
MDGRYAEGMQSCVSYRHPHDPPGAAPQHSALPSASQHELCSAGEQQSGCAGGSSRKIALTSVSVSVSVSVVVAVSRGVVIAVAPLSVGLKVVFL